MKKINHFINGAEYISKSKRFGDVFNPALGEKIAEVSFANDQDVGIAITSAKAAFNTWSKTPPLTRSRIMFKFKELLIRDMDMLAAQVTEEHGKVLSDAVGSVTRGMEVVEFMCGVPHLIKGEFSENVGSNIDSWSMRQPLGICVGITPFNFPAMVPMWMFVVATACGNCFILKPSEKDGCLGLLRCIADPKINSGVIVGPGLRGLKGQAKAFPLEKYYDNDYTKALLWTKSCEAISDEFNI